MASVTVQEFAFMSWVGLTQILHLQNGAWVATAQVRVGEEFRVAGEGSATEPAGTYGAFVPGTVIIRKGETVLASAALQSPSGNWEEYAPFRLTDPSDVGQLEAVVGVGELNRPQGAGLQFTLVAAQAGPAQTSSGSWRTVAPMPTAREGLAAVMGPDGKIYAIGGYNFNTLEGYLNTLEAYNPSTNTWTCSVGDPSSGCSSASMAPMPTARWALAAATGPDGRIYAIGGWNANGQLNAVEAYNPSANTWATVAPLPTRRYLLGAATGSHGRIYALGGCCGGGLSVDTVEAYDPPTNTWSTVASMPTARWALAAATGPDGRIYAIGGSNPQMATDFNTVEVYTSAVSLTATPTVSPTPTPTPTPRVVAVPMVSPVPGLPGAATASFTVTFLSALPGQGEVYFGSGPGCMGLVEVATQDLHPGTTQHTVVVTGNDLPGSVGNNGIIPGVTYWFEVVTVTQVGVEVDDNNGHCYSVTVPT
jgi:hypothetical protein